MMKKKTKIFAGVLAALGMIFAGGTALQIGHQDTPAVKATSSSATFTFAASAETFSNATTATMTVDDITMTHTKNTSSTTMNNPSVSPLRVYSGAKLVFTATAGRYIHSIAFTCNTTTYATALTNATLTPAGTVTVNNTLVTWSDISSNSVSAVMTAQVRLDSLVVTYDSTDVQPASVSLSSSEIHLAIGGAADSSITATGANFASTITWSISGADANVADASIDSSTGVITVTPSATATSDAQETLSVQGTDGTSTKTASLLVTIGKTYSLISSLNDVHPGKIIIASTDGTKAATSALSSTKIPSTNTSAGTNVIYSTPDVGFFTLGLAPVKDEYTIATSSGAYVYGYVSSGYYDLGTKTVLDADCYWSITLTSGTAVLTSLGSTASSGTLEYYGNNFTLYSGTNSLHLYQSETSSLSAISISGTPNQQIAGQSCDTTNLTVQATFADGATADVTNWVSWTPATIAADTTALTASLTFGGVTKEAAVSVSVTSATLSSISFTTAPTKTTYINGQTLDLTGAVVTAAYSDSSTKDVTADCTFSPANGSTLSTDGSITITATYQTKTATTLITVSPKKVTIAKAGTDNTLSSGNLPSDSWTGSGNTAFATSKTAFKTAGNYLEAPNVVPSVSSDAMTTLIVRIYSVVNSATAVDTITVVGLRDQAEISSTSTTIEPYHSSVNNAAAVDSACTLANSKVVYLSATGINGVKITLTTKNANWVVTNVNLSYYTEDETFAYNFLQATNVCDSTGQANNVTSAIWSAQSTAYTNLSSDTFRNNIKNAAANAAGTILEQCGARYDYIVNKYGEGAFANFMSRTIAPSTSNVVENVSGDDGISSAILGATGLVALTGAFLFLKKKKKHA